MTLSPEQYLIRTGNERLVQEAAGVVTNATAVGVVAGVSVIIDGTKDILVGVAVGVLLGVLPGVSITEDAIEDFVVRDLNDQTNDGAEEGVTDGATEDAAEPLLKGSQV